jgi:tRNA dimethylallyltransferase
VIALEPSDRAALHARIAQRLDAMLAAGFVDEVARLRARGDLHLGLPSMRCVGYRQAWEHLDGAGDTVWLRERAIAATRQLAKRQLTWLRAMPARHVIDCLHADAAERIGQLVEELA